VRARVSSPHWSGRFLRAPSLLEVLLWGIVLAAAAQIGAAEPSADQSSIEAHATMPADEQASFFALPTTRDHIGRVVVPTMVNGKGPFRFIVDTGANHSTISPRLVRTLGLTPSEAATIVLDGITGTAQVSAVTVDKLETGDLTMTGIILPVVWAPVMAGADGIFGAAGLNEKSLSVDFLRNKVVISHGVEAAVRTEATKVHAVRATHGVMTVAARVGSVRTLGVIDTGSERTLGNLALRKALKTWRGPGFVVQVTSVYGATKEVESGEIQRAPTIAIESLRISDVAVVFGDFHIFKVWGMHDQPAMIIGMDVLGTVAALSIDFKNQDVYLAGPGLGPGWNAAASGSLADPAQRR
jgi:Aspartyl protease